MVSRDRPCYSMRLFEPFLAVLRTHQELAEVMGGQFLVPNPDDRIPVTMVHGFLQRAVEVTNDPDLGLKAVRHLAFGDVGALDYLVCSSVTVLGAIKVAARYMRLVNEALDVRIEYNDQEAAIRLENSLVMPRAAADFQVGALFWKYWRSWLKGDLSRLSVHFVHECPNDTHEYERTFAPASVSFSRDFDGFVLDRELLQAPLSGADSRLHEVIQKHAEQMLVTLPSVQSVTAEVRNLVAQELTGGNPSAAHIAKRLGMSTRTLCRKLEHEGTTFKELLEEVRKRLAQEYVGSRDFQLSEVALLLGYSQTGAFHRAFRRWTGQTPLAYRRLRVR
jgi:AraC-like DNA-binding protein